MDDFELYINPLGDAQARSQYFRSVLNQTAGRTRPNLSVAPASFRPDPGDDVLNLDRILGERDPESSELEAENDDEDELEIIRQATLAASKTRKPPAPDGTRKGQTYRDAIEKAGLARDRERREEFLSAALALLNETYEKASPSAERRRQQVGILWYEYLRSFFPNTNPDRFWHQDVVESHCLLFLTNLATVTKGRNSEMIRSTTLAAWACDMVTLIGRFCTDRQSGQKTGGTLLSKGLFQKIQTHVNYITHELKLNRFPGPKGYIGRPELLHLYQTIFQHTEALRRASFLQMVVATNIAFHTGCRVGSLGWSEKEYKERGMYPKLRDVKIMVRKRMVWDMEISLNHRKGWNNAMAKPLKFFIEHVTKIHNLWFDTPMLVLTFFVLRGVLQDIEDLFELADYEGSFIKIKEECLDEPLLLERGAQGLFLTNEPASAQGLTATLHRYGDIANLHMTTFHAIRRDAANVFGLIAGTAFAQAMLGHGEQASVFLDSYSKGTYNVPVTRIRLGEYHGTVAPIDKVGLMRHDTEGVVVEALLTSPKLIFKDDEAKDEDEDADADADVDAPADGTNPHQPRRTLNEDQLHEIEEHQDMKQISRNLAAHWARMWPLLPPLAQTRYKDSLGSFNHIFDNPEITGSTLYQENETKIKELYETIQSATKQKGNIQRRLRRPYLDAMRREEQAMKQKIAEDKPAAARAKVMERLGKPSELFRPDAVAKDESSPFTKIYGFSSIKDLQSVDFGKGLLTTEAMDYMLKGNFYEYLKSHDMPDTDEADESTEAETALNPDANTGTTTETAPPSNQAPQATSSEPPAKSSEPTAANSERPADLFQEKPVLPFSDKDELRVLQGDYGRTKLMMMYRVLRPETANMILDHMKMLDGAYKCYLCRDLKHAKPPEWQDTYKNRANLRRHIALTHSGWTDLMVEMLTEDEHIFKCPSDECDFTAEQLSVVLSHCLEDCTDAEVYQKLYYLHHSHGTKTWRVPVEDRGQRIRNAEIRQGRKVNEYTPKLIARIREASVDQLAERGMSLKLSKDMDEARAVAATIKEMGEIATEEIQDDILRDENAGTDFDKLYRQSVSSVKEKRAEDRLNAALREEWDE